MSPGLNIEIDDKYYTLDTGRDQLYEGQLLGSHGKFSQPVVPRNTTCRPSPALVKRASRLLRDITRTVKRSPRPRASQRRTAREAEEEVRAAAALRIQKSALENWLPRLQRDADNNTLKTRLGERFTAEQAKPHLTALRKMKRYDNSSARIHEQREREKEEQDRWWNSLTYLEQLGEQSLHHNPMEGSEFGTGATAGWLVSAHGGAFRKEYRRSRKKKGKTKKSRFTGKNKTKRKLQKRKIR